MLSLGVSLPCSFLNYEHHSDPVCNPALLYKFPAWHHLMQDFQPLQGTKYLGVCMQFNYPENNQRGLQGLLKTSS